MIIPLKLFLEMATKNGKGKLFTCYNYFQILQFITLFTIIFSNLQIHFKSSRSDNHRNANKQVQTIV